MTIKRQATRPVDRVVYPVSFCRYSWRAMNLVRNQMEALTGVTYSHSVISRALALRASEQSSNQEYQDLVRLCRYCASKGKRPNGKDKLSKNFSASEE